MIRRGILKGLGLAALAPASVASPLSGVAIGANLLKNGAVGASNGMGDSIDLAEDEEDKKWDLFQKLSRKKTSVLDRQRIARDLLGGWPPHIACMNSNALWFRAARAAAYIQKQEELRLEMREGLKATIWKKAKDAIGL